MLISKQALQAHNARIQLSYNEHYNVLHKLGTREERQTLRDIASDKHGIMNYGNQGYLTVKNVTEAGHTMKRKA